MAFMLRKLSARARTVVAVVGAGHLSGIRCGPAGSLHARGWPALMWLLLTALWRQPLPASAGQGVRAAAR